EVGLIQSLYTLGVEANRTLGKARVAHRGQADRCQQAADRDHKKQGGPTLRMSLLRALQRAQQAHVRGVNLSRVSFNHCQLLRWWFGMEMRAWLLRSRAKGARPPSPRPMR